MAYYFAIYFIAMMIKVYVKWEYVIFQIILMVTAYLKITTFLRN